MPSGLAGGEPFRAARRGGDASGSSGLRPRTGAALARGTGAPRPRRSELRGAGAGLRRDRLEAASAGAPAGADRRGRPCTSAGSGAARIDADSWTGPTCRWARRPSLSPARRRRLGAPAGGRPQHRPSPIPWRTVCRTARFHHSPSKWPRSRTGSGRDPMQGSTSMTDTANLGLPLVQPAQAQKHVTVNEALARHRRAGATDAGLGQRDGSARQPGGGHGLWRSGGRGECLGGAGGACRGCHRRRLGLRSGAHGMAGHGARRGRDGGLRRRGLAPRRGDAEPRGRVAEPPVAGNGRRAFARRIGGHVRWPFRRAPSSSGSRAGSLRRSRERRPVGRSAWRGTRPASAPAWGWRRIHGSNGPGAPVVYWDATPLVVTAIGGDFAAGAIRLVAHFAEIALPHPSSEASLSSPAFREPRKRGWASGGSFLPG
jgi:hypothetical protein